MCMMRAYRNGATEVHYGMSLQPYQIPIYKYEDG